MTTNTWTPAPNAPASIPAEVLNKMITAGEQTEPDTKLLADSDVKNYRHVMRQDLGFWQNQANTLNDDQTIALIRFFVAAEEANTDWHGGEQSPVIFLNKMLKQRGTRLDKALLQWIKSNSSNQFLPNGPVVF